MINYAVVETMSNGPTFSSVTCGRSSLRSGPSIPTLRGRDRIGLAAGPACRVPRELVHSKNVGRTASLCLEAEGTIPCADVEHRSSFDAHGEIDVGSILYKRLGTLAGVTTP